MAEVLTVQKCSVMKISKNTFGAFGKISQATPDAHRKL
jgi:hypothetical protein